MRIAALAVLLFVGCGGATELAPVSEADAAPNAAPVTSPAPAVDAAPRPSCVDPRFTVKGDRVLDSKTGLAWMWDVEAAVPGLAPDFCALTNGGRSPTAAQLSTLLLHPGACVPALDQGAFVNASRAGAAYATDGCVNFTTGEITEACSGKSFAMLCLAP